AAGGVRAGVGMPEMQTAIFPAAALSDWLRASASSFRWSQTLAVSLCLSHCLSVRAICDRQCYAAGPDCPILVPSEALRGSDFLARRRQLQDLGTAREMTSLRGQDGRDCLKVKAKDFGRPPPDAEPAGEEAVSVVLLLREVARLLALP